MIEATTTLSAGSGANATAIAIVGLAGRFPDASTLDEFWRNVSEGVESLRTFSDEELDAAGIPAALRADTRHVRRGTPLDDADKFDAAFFGLSAREAQILDPQHRLFLEVCWEALEHAGIAAGSGDASIGVYAGSSMNTYLLTQLARNPALLERVGGYQVMLGNDKDFLATRVSYKLDLHGPSMSVQTACSTSLVAVEVACRALQRGECDVALAGGVSLTFPQTTGYSYQEGMIFSPDGHCRPFDADAKGTRAGNGAGVVVLKRLADAIAERDTIHAVIIGAAVNNDGANKAGYTAPSVDGQVEVIATAHALAGVSPRSISYVEAHGTATPLGDPIEIAALTQAFRAGTEDAGFCRLGSLKANIGHLDAAAGVAGLIKTVLALEHRTIPPLVNFKRPNPQLMLESSPFLASAEASEWTTQGAEPRRAGVSSFGIGGTNAHVVLQEAPAVVRSPEAAGPRLLLLSARTAGALDKAAAKLAAHLEAHPEQPLGDVAWTLATGRKAFAHRLAIVAGTHAEAAERLRAVKAGAARANAEGARPVAFLFSGQGSQHAEMGAALYRTEPVYRDAVDRCAAVLQRCMLLDIRDILYGAESGASIDRTEFTQPALFVTEYALAALWKSWGVEPAAMLGHSIGEYVAAHLAGVMSLEAALQIVAARGRLMQSMPPGSMAAVPLGVAGLQRYLGAGLDIAAINGPDLITVAGTSQAVAGLIERLAADGIEARLLHTSHAFHSASMEAALEPFKAVVAAAELHAPSTPYLSNVTGTWITTEQATSPAYYAEHLRGTVRFESGVKVLAADPGLMLLEAGPGTTLASLARLSLGKDAASRVVASLPHPKDPCDAREALLGAAGRLWAAGVPLDFVALHGGREARRVPLPTYPFERVRHWVEPAASAAASAPASADPGPALDRLADTGDWAYAPTWHRDDSLPPNKDRAGEQWLVLGDVTDDMTDGVMRHLSAAGAAAHLVVSGVRFERIQDGDRFASTVRPTEEADFAQVVAAIGPVTGAISLWSARDPSLDTCYAMPVALASALAAAGRHEARIILATAGAESVLDERVARPLAALAIGPALCLPSEVPGLAVRCVDFVEMPPGRADGSTQAASRCDALARALVREAGSFDAEPLVAHRAGRRWIRRLERLHLPAASAETLPLKRHGVYFVTGGLGGIGSTLAQWLAETCEARLVLTSRTQLPAAQERKDWLAAHDDKDPVSTALRAIARIEEAGGTVMTAVADVADLDAMSAALEAARSRFGRIDGVIHAAGIAGTGAMASVKARRDVEAVVSPKVEGLAVLTQLLGHEPLDFVALMSSINAVAPAAGVGDYAAANAVLDAFASSSERPAAWKRVVAFDWSAWSELGMATKLAMPAERRDEWKAFVAQGIPTAAGTELFARVLAADVERVVISPFDLLAATARARGAQSEKTAPASRPAAPEQSSSSAPSDSRPADALGGEQPATPTEHLLAGIWIELLGCEHALRDDNFFELGGHSLMATRVLTRVADSTGARLTLRDIFDTPTLRGMAGVIDAKAGGAAQGHESHAVDDDREELEF